MPSRLASFVAALFQRRVRLPQPGERVVWWTTYTGDSHYYRLVAGLDRDPRAHDGMPWTLDLSQDQQPYERKYCATSSAALDLQEAWKRMVRRRGLGRVYWVGSASMGRFDVLVVPREGQWRLLLYIKDRHAETRTFPSEEGAVAAAHALDYDLRRRPWFSWEAKDPTEGGA